MHALAEYIICVSAAAFVCGIVNSLMPKGPAKEVLKLVGGLFLAFSVIRPVADIRIPELAEVSASWQEEASEAAALGEEMAREAAAESIKQELEAYILDKAGELRLTVEAEVFLEEETLLPESVTVSGNAAPNSRQRLTDWIESELGISEEDIRWIG